MKNNDSNKKTNKQNIFEENKKNCDNNENPNLTNFNNNKDKFKNISND